MSKRGNVGYSFQYVNGEPALCLFPLRKKMNSGAYIVPLSVAHQYTDDAYVVEASSRAAMVMGLDVDRHTTYNIACIFNDSLDELVHMPPEPRKIVEVAEAVIHRNGKSETVTIKDRVPKI